MVSTFADELFRPGVPESKKLELIYLRGASLSEDDLRYAVDRLRADCRYARLLGALIDASKNKKLAIEALFYENRVAAKIVTSCKWLYMIANRGFVSEDFIRNTLPSVSYSSQMRIANKISKWVTNTNLGDKLFAIVHNRCIWLSWMLLGACSNDLIMKQLEIDKECLSSAQMLDILKKRFNSGIELIQSMNAEGKLTGSSLNTKEIFHYILKHDLQRGLELIQSTGVGVVLGRHLTHKLLQDDMLRTKFLCYCCHLVKQRVLAQRAPADVYRDYFFAKFNVKDYGQNRFPKLEFLKHLKDDEKFKTLNAWYVATYGSTMVEYAGAIPKEFLFLLDEESLQRVVTRRIAIASDQGLDSDLQFWQSMLPDDYESFKLQKERLKGESSQEVREGVYLNMLNSVFILRRPQYLARRLKFLVPRTRNDYDSQEALVTLIRDTLEKDYRFTLNEKIWPYVKELIDLQLFLKNEAMHENYQKILFVALKQVSLEDQKTLSEAIMQELNEVQVLIASEDYDVTSFPREKRQFFWDAALRYRENLEDTTLTASGKVCPGHLQNFYVALAEAKEDTRDLIKNYPKTMQILNIIVGPEMSSEKFPNLEMEDVYSIYKMLEPLLPSGEAIPQKIKELIEKEKAETEKIEVLKAFRKSKLITDEVRAIYTKECHNRNFVLRCGRSLLHADTEQFPRWLTMLEEYIGKAAESQKVPKRYSWRKTAENKSVMNSYILKTMISTRSKLEEELTSLYSTKEKDSDGLIEIKDRKDSYMVRSFRYVEDSGFAYEMTVQFMKLHCWTPRFYGARSLLKCVYARALCSFNHHLSQLPVATVSRCFREHILREDFGVRVYVLRNILTAAQIYEEQVVFGMLEQLVAHKEDQAIMHETLRATYDFVARFGEEKGWRLLKLCLDSVDLSKRDTSSGKDKRLPGHFILNNCWIDEYIPTNIDYLMRIVFDVPTPTRSEELVRIKYSRLASNMKMLPLDFALEIFETTKRSDWSSQHGYTLVAMSILTHFVPTHAETLKTHFSCLGETLKLDLKNLTKLTKHIVETCVGKRMENADKVLNFLCNHPRSKRNIRELCLLKLTKHILPLLPENGMEADHLLSFRAIALAALNKSVEFLDAFGNEFYPALVTNLKILLSALPKMDTRYILGICDEAKCQTKTAMLLSCFDSEFWDKKALEEFCTATAGEMIGVAVRTKLRPPRHQMSIF